MSTDDEAGETYTNHFEEYYAKQWDLLDEHLSPANARLVKRVINNGEDERGWATSTARNHMRNIRFVITLGVERDDVSDDPTEWTATEWNMLVTDLAVERGVSTGQKRAYASAVKAFIWHCKQTPDGLRRHDIDSPKQQRTEIDTDNVLSHDEVMALIEAANNSRDRALIAAMYQGGLRRGAAVQINIRNYDDRDEWATVKIPQVEGVKGADGNIKPLTWAKGYIDSWLEDHPDDENPDAPLFCSVRKQDDGKRVTGHSVYTMLKRLAEGVDIEDDRIHPHMFKHARATYMRASPRFDKKDIEQVMDWVESTPMHARYSHADQPAEAARVAQKMGIDVDEHGQEEDVDCPRCNRKVPPAASYCPHCTLKITDEPPEWWQVYKSVTTEEAPLRKKYDDMTAAIPPLERLDIQELHRVRLVIRFATYLLEDETYESEVSPDLNEYVRPFDNWDDATEAMENIVEPVEDLLPERYSEQPGEFEAVQGLFLDFGDIKDRAGKE